MVKNKQCLACGEKFSYCPDCSRIDKLKPAWASQFCVESCATLWATLTKFGMSMITKSEAKEIISSLDLKPIDIYVACVQRDYAKVMAEEKKSRKIKKFEPIIEAIEPIDKPVAEEVEIPTVHEVVLKEEE